MSVDRHAYYLELKARNYFKDPCPSCGRLKSKEAKHCKVCAGYAPSPSLCACGQPKTRQALYCQTCAGFFTPSRRKPPVNDPPNTYCPNQEWGSLQCETYRPHRHCECGEPTEPERTMCDLCKKEAARIANKHLTRVA